MRQFQVALKRLRQFSTRIDAPKTELDLDKTIEETCNNAGYLKLFLRSQEKYSEAFIAYGFRWFNERV